MNKQSNRPKKSRVKTWSVVVGLLVIAALIGFLVITKLNNNKATPQYQTVKAEKGTLTATIGATGTVRSNQSALLTWQTTGTIDVIKVKPGDQIKADDVLASLVLPPVTQTTLESNLVTAQENLAELTSPEA